MSVTGVTAAALALATIAGCSGPADAQAHPTAAGIDLSASLDEANDVVTLPSDRLMLSAEENSVLNSAASLLIADCAKAQGIDFSASPVPDDIALRVREPFGPWLQAYVEKFAFVGPQSEADLAANGVSRADGPVKAATTANGKALRHNAQLSGADLAVVDKCREDGAAQFDATKLVKAGPWANPLGSLWVSFWTDDSVKQVVAKYESCLEAEGLTPDPEVPLGVKGASTTEISESQIRMALKVVDCKERTDLVRKLSDIMATKQAAIIVKYGPELVNQRQQIDAALTAAHDVLASHGVKQ